MATTYMTAEGLQKLKDELHLLETIERPRVIAAIAEAREKGDLSENAEYDAAKEEQGVLESKIAMIKAKIMDARIIDETTISTDEVQILTKVKVLNLKTNQEKMYQLVTEGEANVAEGKLATTTPIAKGLLGKKVGEIAEVVVPAGKLQFKILEISL
ncbi:MAG: transcription elongation factor GreA [Paludibacteraceae bacterium]|nr:transcription elongation factor GreA [Paludibacteraceae bacterium]